MRNLLILLLMVVPGPLWQEKERPGYRPGRSLQLGPIVTGLR